MRVDGYFCSLKTSNIDLHWQDKTARIWPKNWGPAVTFPREGLHDLYRCLLFCIRIYWTSVRDSFSCIVKEKPILQRKTLWCCCSIHRGVAVPMNDWVACGGVAGTFSEVSLYHGDLCVGFSWDAGGTQSFPWGAEAYACASPGVTGQSH